MNDRAICLPWDKKFVLTPLGQTVVYGELWKKLLKFTRQYGDILVCQYTLGQTEEKSSIWGYTY